MKIRTLPVTNSSSTYYCIVGTTIDKLIDKSAGNIIKSAISSDIIQKFNLSFEYDESADDIYAIGSHIESMSEDETLRAFKTGILANLKKIVPNISYKDISIIISGYYG